MPKLSSWTIAVMLALGSAGCAPVITSQTVMVAGVGPVEIEHIDVEIVAVAPEEHVATVRQGRFVWDVLVPPAFGDLSNIHPGDKLSISRVEGVILSARRARKGAKPSIIYTEAVSGPPFQNLPDKFVARALTVTARFERFDPETGIVSYVGPAGPQSLSVIDPVLKRDLRHFKRGDLVALTLAEAVYIEKL